MSDRPAVRVVAEALCGSPDPSWEEISAVSETAYKIVRALITAGHLPVPDCRDCGVKPGEPHIPGCDVARCKTCGWQDIGDHHCPDDRPSTVWTGRWPGEVEVEEYGLKDLNHLSALCRNPDAMRWDRDAERWFTKQTGQVGVTASTTPT